MSWDTARDKLLVVEIRRTRSAVLPDLPHSLWSGCVQPSLWSHSYENCSLLILLELFDFFKDRVFLWCKCVANT